MTYDSMVAFPNLALRSLSLFTGAGGMDIGLERSGFVPLCYLDNDPVAKETIHLNRPGWQLWEDGDVMVAASMLKPIHFNLAAGDLDLISGGPPCQPFSAAAQWAAKGRRGMTDFRARTVHAFLTIVESFLPKWSIR